MNQSTQLTKGAINFYTNCNIDNFTPDIIHMSKRCFMDGLAVIIAGTEQPALKIMEKMFTRLDYPHESRLLGKGSISLPVELAARWNGLAGHAMDWDDTQLSKGENRLYGLLTHPTIPPLASGIAVADKLKNISGRQFIEAFVAGVEVECKLNEVINPSHYVKGFHSSGTFGTFGAVTTASKLLGLDQEQYANALGIAVSLAAGIRVNFGTMTKPLHVGRAAENGVTAALFAQSGFTANNEAFDGPWGYITVAGQTGDPDPSLATFGEPFTIIDPGVSIKPYPSGVLTHPSMDAMKKIMDANNIQPNDIKHVKLFAGNNILGPIRYKIAKNELEGKFSMAFLLSSMIIAGRAGKKEFTDDFVQSKEVQDMQSKVSTHYDEAIEKLGVDKIRSRIEVETQSGDIYSINADENYRGGPDNPLSEEELENKFEVCAENLLNDDQVSKIKQFIWTLDEQKAVDQIIDLTNYS
tara:strand:- start:15117 stop:16520 length:1404 start_codon:yes stop_codon:yes gene_type:complete